MDTLLYTADLRSAIVRISSSLMPASVWLTLPGQEHPVPAWPLTAMAWVALWQACVKLEDRWSADQYPRARIEVIWERWQKIDCWAVENLGEEALLSARALGGPIEIRGPDPPPLYPVMTPFRDYPPEADDWLVLRKPTKQAPASKARKPAQKRVPKRREKTTGGLFDG